MTTNLDTEQVIRDATTGLRKRFPARPPEELEAIVREEMAAFQDRPVKDYLSILTERAARARLMNSSQ